MTSVRTSSESDIEATERLQRVFEAAGCTTQVELAAFLGIQQSSISDAKKRKAIPADWLMMKSALLNEKHLS